MKAITILQPYAGLIAEGIKTIETRSQLTNYRGPIAIHAGKSTRALLLMSKPVKEIIRKEGLNPDSMKDLCGQVIATAELVDCVKIDNNFVRELSQTELLLGDYNAGRYAWILKCVGKIKPVSARGQLGLWNWN